MRQLRVLSIIWIVLLLVLAACGRSPGATEESSMITTESPIITAGME